MENTLDKPFIVNYDVAFDYLMEWEDSTHSGKITEDAGGKTKFGISEHAYPALDIDSLTLEEAKDIYKKDYWEKGWEAGKYSQTMINKFFQIKVNLGPTGWAELYKVVFYIHTTPNFLEFAVAQLMHYKERYGSLERVPKGLIRRAQG